MALLIAVTLVLLIATVNVANLTLLRSASRLKEISIRAALGARSRDIIRQLVTESLLLAALGGALGALGAVWGVGLLVKLAPQDIPRLDQIGMDWRLLGWTALISLLTGVVCGLRPAWQCARLNLNEALKEGGRTSTEATGQRRWRSALVVVELALAVMLLTGAGLFLKSWWRLQHVDLGINPERVLTAYFELPNGRYKEEHQFLNFYEQMLNDVRALPGVRAAALSNSLPPYSTEFSDDFRIESRPVTSGQIPPIAYVIRVSPDYFRSLDITLQRGRFFTDADIKNSPRVTIINATLQRRFFPNEDAIGKRINTGNDQQPIWNEIVGVVGDVKYNGMADEVQPAFYQPLAQAQSSSINLILKTDTADPLVLTPPLRNLVKSIDNELPVGMVESMDQRVALDTAHPRFRATLISIFAVLALVLACIGVYGVISYSVANRTHEIGIRMALGAGSFNVLKLVIGQGMKLSIAGILIGLIAAFGLTRLMHKLLFEVSASDPSTFMTVAMILSAVALLACYIPARRATKVDPLTALHDE